MNASKKKRRRDAVKPHTLPVEQRKLNFHEVNLGYLNQDEVIAEVDRCFSCRRAKCSLACPANFDIPSMMNSIKEGDIQTAADFVNTFYCIPKSFNRICPAFCEDACLAGKKGDPLQILNIKRFLADNFDKPESFYEFHPPTRKQVAIIGAGPAGITAVRPCETRTCGYSI